MRKIRARILLRSRGLRIALMGGAVLGVVACQEAPPEREASPVAVAKPAAAPAKPADAETSTSAPSQDESIARGKSVYNSNCIACHNADPTQDGAIGPANAGSSMALLEAKVIHNTYPPGYTPKRETNAMIALPHLAKDIPALHAFLNASN